MLPLEQAVVYAGNTKSITNMSEGVSHSLGEAGLYVFYTAPKTKRIGGIGWSDKRIDQVEWRKLAATLD